MKPHACPSCDVWLPGAVHSSCYNHRNGTSTAWSPLSCSCERFPFLGSIEIRQTLELRLLGPDSVRKGECLACLLTAVVIHVMIDRGFLQGNLDP